MNRFALRSKSLFVILITRGFVVGILAPAVSTASENCNLQGNLITLAIQVCLKGSSDQYCYDKMDHYRLRFNEDRIFLSKEQGVALTIELGHPPKDILDDKEYVKFLKHINQLHSTDTYKKYIISANRQGHLIQLQTDITKILFGRWNSSTRTDYEISLDNSCQACSLSKYSAVTDKAGFSLNHQTAGESRCVIE